MATLGSEAKRARRMGERRLKRLDAVIADASKPNSNIPERVKNWAVQMKKEIKSAIQGTRQYAKDGHRYKSKSESYIRRQIERLNEAVSRVVPRYESPRDTFASTTLQINLASSQRTEGASIYTKSEVQLFYRVTEDIWDRPGVTVSQRNELILEYYNNKRAEVGMPPMSLSEIMSMILASNKAALEAEELNPRVPLTEEQLELYNTAVLADDSDDELGSPTMASVVQVMRGYINVLLNQPDATSF